MYLSIENNFLWISLRCVFILIENLVSITNEICVKYCFVRNKSCTYRRVKSIMCKYVSLLLENFNVMKINKNIPTRDLYYYLSRPLFHGIGSVRYFSGPSVNYANVSVAAAVGNQVKRNRHGSRSPLINAIYEYFFWVCYQKRWWRSPYYCYAIYI